METKCQIYAVAMVIGYIRHISLCFGNRTGCISVIFHFGQQHGYVTGFDKNRLGRTHQANSFPSPIDRFIHGLTIYGYFTVHSSQSSVCFPRGWFLWPVWRPQVHGCFSNGPGASWQLANWLKTSSKVDIDVRNWFGNTLKGLQLKMITEEAY